MRHAIVLALALLVTACGGADPVETTGVADTPSTMATATPTPTERVEGAETPTGEAAVTATESAGTASPTPAAATLTVDAGDLAGRGYTVAVETSDGQLTSVGSLDEASAGLPLPGIDASMVRAVSIHAGDDPAASQMWFGPIQDGTGQLLAVLPADLLGVSGRYILATPTDGADSNETSGIWYVLIPRAPGLDLPVLPEGWTYEGWVSINGVDLTTGRFTDPPAPMTSTPSAGPSRPPRPCRARTSCSTPRRA